MQGTAGDKGDPKAKDPVDQTSSRVQAVACFYPPTDFLNYGKPGENALGRGILSGFKPPFDFHQQDPKTKVFRPISDESRILEIGRQIESLQHEARAAGARYDALNSNFQRLQTQMGGVNDKSIQLEALDREATVNRNLLEHMLTRQKPCVE